MALSRGSGRSKNRGVHTYKYVLFKVQILLLHLAKSGGANAFCRAVVIGGAGGALATPEFRSSVDPIPTRGGRLCPLILVPPDLKT